MIGYVLGGIVALLLLLGSCSVTTYNGLISARNSVDEAWANVEAAYQRRLDTIPKFAKTAQFSADFQKKLAIEHAKAREGIANAAASGDPQQLQKAANDGIAALVIAVRQEAVPEAKLDQLTELNSAIDNVERVINHERDAYNAALKGWRDRRQGFPGNWVGDWFGITPPIHTKFFEAEAGAERSPDFDLKLN